ncbi:MAG: DUF2333 family protein [Parvibaculum sp.]
MSMIDRLSALWDSLRQRWLYRKGDWSMPSLDFWRRKPTTSATGAAMDDIAGSTGWTVYIKRGALALLAILLLYYPVGMLMVHNIDDDADFTAPPGDRIPGGSESVAIAAALIDREVDQKSWTANDPFFQPGYMLDNMPNFQQGIMSALARFGFELTDQIGRTRGSSEADANLQRAGGLLQYPGNVWLWNPGVSLAIRASSESQYRDARRELLAYNARLAKGQAVFDARGDNLLATLDRFAADLGSASAVLDRQVTEHSGDLYDFKADNVFYFTKGKLYAYYLVLRGLGEDFAPVLKERNLQAPWAQMLESMRMGAELAPWVVVNGEPDALFRPSHLAAQGFYLLRARTQLREITNILLK